MNPNINNKHLPSCSTFTHALALISGTVGVHAMLSAPVAYAQLEEVVVTARKREESLQDVPIAITAYKGEALQDYGVVSVEMLAPSVPGFYFTQAPGPSDQITIRGIGTTGVGAQFEQAVGFVQDGFFFGRSRFGRSAFLDLQRIEILKGPQGALIGKNTSAGAVNISTNKPTDSFEGYVASGYNFEGAEGFDLEAVISGPISDSVRGRIATRYADNDGWIANLASGNDVTVVEDATFRGQLEVDLSENLMATLLYQRMSSEREGKQLEMINCLPGTFQPAFGEDCTLNAVRNSRIVVQGEVEKELSELDIDLLGVSLNWEFDNFEVVSLTSYTDYSVDEFLDVDLTPEELISDVSLEDLTQFSQEFRLASTGTGSLDYIVGVYYADIEVRLDQTFDFIPGGMVRRTQLGSTDTESLAVFAQIDWHISDEWTLTLGGRYTREEKDGAARQFVGPIYTDDEDVSLCVLGGPGFRRCNDLNDSLSETDFSPNTTIRWSFADDQMLYATYSRGFKGGGFQYTSGNPMFDSNGDIASTAAQDFFVFDDEQSNHIELGGKHTLLDRTLNLNWAIWHTEVDDLQVAALDPVTASQVTGNADVLSQGVEFDLTWTPLSGLLLNASGSLMSAEFDGYDTASCFTGQSESQGCVGGVQDLDGAPLPYAPDRELTLGASYVFEIGGGLQLKPNIRWQFVDDVNLAVDNDPIDSQESFDRLDAGISLEPANGKWHVSFLGKNLTDEIVAGFANDLPGFPGNHFAISQQTRSYELRGRFNF